MTQTNKTAAAAHDLDLLTIDFRTLFVPAGHRRIARENDPDRSKGPLFWLGGSASGNVFGVRQDVADKTAAELLALAETEPPFVTPGTLPRNIARYETLLAEGGKPPARDTDSVYELPHGLARRSDHDLIASGSEAANRFEADILRDGMPKNLVDLKMRVLADLWAPWCMLLIDGEVAAAAFAARLSEEGAELGLATVPKFRGQGLAARMTAAWTRHADLAQRRLFYSASETNHASQSVIRQLGLRQIGMSVRLG